ncbi:MAG: PAS domain S-box protein [Burkholderiaceae bacterium]
MSSSEIESHSLQIGTPREAVEPGETRGVRGGGVHGRDLGAAVAAERTPGPLEERMTRAMQIDTVGILSFRPDGRIIDCNDAFLRMSGVARGDVTANRVRWDALTPSEWLPASQRALDEFDRTGRTTPYEMEYVRPDGTRWWGLFAATRVGPDEGVEYIIDITERKRAEAARHATEAEFRAMFELSSVGQFQSEVPTGRILRANRRFCEMLGYREEELRQRTLHELTHPEDHALARSTFDRLVEDHAAETSLEKRMLHRDGTVVWVNINFTLMRDAEGRPVRTAAIVRDVTAQKATEQALAESREHLHLIVESARDYAIIATDLQRRVTSWNPGAERVTGYVDAEMVGNSVDALFVPEDRARGAPEQEAGTALKAGRATNERWHLRKDGSRFWGSGLMMPMRNERGEAVGFVKIFRDQTAVRESNEALKRSRAELREALRQNEQVRREIETASRAKDHFLAVLSHELRTPLTPVLMAAQTLSLRSDLPEGVRQAVEMIQRNVRLESHFIDDLLDLTRISRGTLEMDPENTDLHDVVREAISLVEPQLQAKRQRITVELGAERHVLRADRTRIVQVVWNVLNNAMKFTPPEGEVRVASSSTVSGFRLAVADSGIGILPDKLPLIFDAFNQAGEWVAREYGGLGLGLAISRAVVEAHGGKIRAESPGKDRGTTVTIELPLT